MPRYVAIAVLTFTVLAVADVTQSRSAQEYPAAAALEAIAADYDAGRLTLDQKAQLQIQAITQPSRLPDTYQADRLATAVVPAPCPSVVLAEIRRQWHLLSSETRQAFRTAFDRDSTTYTFISPSGYFSLHYETDTADTHAVPAADDDSSGVPDFIERCAAYCDSGYYKHMDLGYLLPPHDGGLGGDTLYDIYFMEMGFYGFCVPEGPGPQPWNDNYSHVVLNNDFVGFPPNSDPEGDVAGAAKSTCAHEFHHGCQYAYDIAEENWIMELDATWFEDIAFDQSDDNYNYLGNFFGSPDITLMENAGNHPYGSFIWASFLSQTFDTSLMRALWEGARWQEAFDVLADTLSTRYGWSIDSAFTEFATWNYCTAARDDGLHYEEGSGYPLISVGRTHLDYPVMLQTSPVNPEGYAACYVEFFPGGEIGDLRLFFNGNDAREWDACVIKSTADNVHQFDKIELDGVSYHGSIEIPDFESYHRITLLGVNRSEFSGGAFFNYSAEIIPPYEVSSEILTTDSAVYSGGLREFEYRVTNVSPLNDLLEVTAWDIKGWVDRDTQYVSLGPGQSWVMLIPVNPPVGTSLGTTSGFTFKVRSMGDTTRFDMQPGAAVVRLQHGDTDFDGHVQISDVTYLVAYLFVGGQAPQPIDEAGDFTCDGGVNVADLTSLVEFLFTGGDASTCNPY